MTQRAEPAQAASENLTAVRILIAVLFVAALLLFGCGFLPVALLRDRAESLVPGHSLTLTAERLAALRSGFRTSAALLLFNCAVLLSFREEVPGLCRGLFGGADWRGALKEISLPLRGDPWISWAFLAIFVAGTAFRLLEISRPIRLDEAFAYFSYWNHPPYWAISDYSSSNNHLFHSLLATFSRILFGSSVLALRLPALIGGVLMLPVAFATGTALYGRAAGLAASALIASAPPFIDYSALAKGYSWQCLLTLLTVLFASRLVEERASLPNTTGFVISATLALWTVPTSILPVTSVLLWMSGVVLIRDGRSCLLSLLWKLRPALLAIAALTMLCYLPALLVSGPGAIFANRFVAPMQPGDFVALTPGLLDSTWTRWNEGVPPAARVCIYVGIVTALAMHHRLGRQPVPFLPVLALFCAAFVVARRVHIYSRVWLFVWLFALLTAAAGIAFALVRPSLVAAFAVLLTFTAGSAVHRDHTVLWSMENGNVQGLDEAAAWMAHNLSSRDRIIGSSLAGAPLDYILRRTWPSLEPQVECVTSGLPMCGSRAAEKGPMPERLVAVIAKQPAIDDGRATNPATWAISEATPAGLLFARHARLQYSEPRLLLDRGGITIWVASLAREARSSSATENPLQ